MYYCISLGFPSGASGKGSACQCTRFKRCGFDLRDVGGLQSMGWQRAGLTERLTVISHFSSVGLFATLWAVACHAPLSMEFSRQEYWSRLPFPSPGYRPNSGTEHTSAALAGGFFTTCATREACTVSHYYFMWCCLKSL